ncbi:folate-binding protein [Methylobacillus arboreus]|uniref:CAF17-like 4Fe-4S cluster assembly/insertion protein YgfZ n=1 Tax=Methylobacillus arboreus TaxID=755170 RepID=UPI001E373865|nr:folate-binding protein [Methylobacillus arboreus]MCB5189357.1 folate-binding protein [Methylobacillus arboreus]
MSPWHQFLSAQGAEVQDGNIRFPNAVQAEDSIITDLSHYGLLSLEGEDVVTFLQGQVTNDVKKLDGTSSHYSGYCSPKGRLLTLFFAFASNGKLYLQFDRGLVEAIAKRLRMYVLRSKVVVTDLSDETVRIGVAGNKTEAALSTFFKAIPAAEYQLVQENNISLIRLPGGLPRYEIIVPAQQATELWTALSQHLTPANKADWDWREIQAGIPEIVAATQEAFVPQMVNLDLLNGINFKKGCYTGQEIVARTHYLGKVKRRTHLAHISSDTTPAAGDDILDASGTAAGQVVRSAPNPNGGQDILAELRLESVEAGTLSWQDKPLTITPLPYALEK